MSFQSPWLLVGLALIPALCVAYVLTERRRRRAAAAFASPRVAVSAVPRSPGWRRHLPLGLAGLATAALIAALARPQVSVAVPAEQATIVLAMDHSGSMMATDVAPSRLQAAEDAGAAFLDEVPDRVRVGGVVFNHRAQAVSSPTTDRAEVRTALEARDDAERRHRDRRRARDVAGDDPRAEGAGRDRAALRRQGHARAGPAADRRRRPRRPACRSTPSRWVRRRGRCPTATRSRRTSTRCARSRSARAARRSPPTSPTR